MGRGKDSTAHLLGTATGPLQTPAYLIAPREVEKGMDPWLLIQHPLDRFSLTESMADLDARGRDAVDQLMTMIGDLQFCRHDIRGTCARYFSFIDTVCLSHLCFSAHIDFGRLQTYLWAIEHEAAGELDNTFDDAQMPFCFPENEDQPAGVLTPAPGTQSELLCANNEQTHTQAGGWGPSIHPPPKRIQTFDTERLGNAVTRRKA
jgi:hypothetical protein